LSRVRFCSPSLFRLRENQLLLTAGGCYPGVSGGFLSPGEKKNIGFGFDLISQ